MKPKLKEIQRYRDDEGVSQSLLKSITTGYISRKKKTLSMTLGSLYDCYICTYELLEDLFIISDGKRPTDVICQIVEYVFNNSLVIDFSKLEDFESMIEESFQSIVYQGKWKTETKIKKVIEEGSEYFDLLKVKGERELVTQKEVDEACKTVSLLYQNNPAKSVLQNTTEFQKALYGQYNGVRIKGLLDCFYINEAQKVIIITDIKRTDFNFRQLKHLIKKFRYDFQLSFYKELVQQNYPEYDVICQLLFISAFDGRSALVVLSEVDLDFAKTGFYNISGTVYSSESDKSIVSTDYNPGWETLIEVYKQSIELNVKDFNIEHFCNGGIYNFKSIHE